MLMTEMVTIRFWNAIQILMYVSLLIRLCCWAMSQITELDSFMAELDLRFFSQRDEVPQDSFFSSIIQSGCFIKEIYNII